MPGSVPPVVELARVPRGVPRVDVAIAGGLFLWAALEAVLADGPGSVPVRLAIAAGLTLPLLLRRRLPVPVMLAITAVTLLRSLTGDTPEEGTMPFPALLIGTFSAALYARPAPLALVALPLPALTIPLAGFEDTDLQAGDIAILSFFSAGAWLGGWLVRRRAAQVERALAEAPGLAAEAVGAERARLARELHDVVAHSVSIITVQAGAADALLERDPARAREHLDAVRTTAHDALVELRRLVGVLREDEATYAPQPGLGRLDDLLAESRAAGLPVELRREGRAPALPPGVDLTAYRIVQESLSNVRRHAGRVATRVRVRYGEDAVEVEVTNDPGAGDRAPGPGTGHGLIGMRERARLYGGTLEAGPSGDGGFVVRARLPLESLPA